MILSFFVSFKSTNIASSTFATENYAWVVCKHSDHAAMVIMQDNLELSLPSLPYVVKTSIISSSYLNNGSTDLFEV